MLPAQKRRNARQSQQSRGHGLLDRNEEKVHGRGGSSTTLMVTIVLVVLLAGAGMWWAFLTPSENGDDALAGEIERMRQRAQIDPIVNDPPPAVVERASPPREPIQSDPVTPPAEERREVPNNEEAMRRAKAERKAMAESERVPAQRRDEALGGRLRNVNNNDDEPARVRPGATRGVAQPRVGETRGQQVQGPERASEPSEQAARLGATRGQAPVRPLDANGRPAMRTRTLQWPVFFWHIPKTGGTFLRQQLNAEARKRGQSPVWLMMSNPSAVESAKNTPMFVATHENVQSVFEDETLHSLIDNNFSTLTMLRHPVSQIISRYYYYNKEDTWSTENLLEYAREHSNMQSRFLALSQGEEKANLDKAVRALDRMDFILIHDPEKLVDGIAYMRYVGLVSPDLGIISSGRATANKPSIRSLGKDVLEEIACLHRQDLRLFKYASLKFLQQIEVVAKEPKFIELRNQAWADFENPTELEGGRESHAEQSSFQERVRKHLSDMKMFEALKCK